MKNIHSKLLFMGKINLIYNNHYSWPWIDQTKRIIEWDLLQLRFGDGNVDEIKKHILEKNLAEPKRRRLNLGRDNASGR